MKFLKLSTILSISILIFGCGAYESSTKTIAFREQNYHSDTHCTFVFRYKLSNQTERSFTGQEIGLIEKYKRLVLNQGYVIVPNYEAVTGPVCITTYYLDLDYELLAEEPISIEEHVIGWSRP